MVEQNPPQGKVLWRALSPEKVSVKTPVGRKQISTVVSSKEVSDGVFKPTENKCG